MKGLNEIGEWEESELESFGSIAAWGQGTAWSWLKAAPRLSAALMTCSVESVPMASLLRNYLEVPHISPALSLP